MKGNTTFSQVLMAQFLEIMIKIKSGNKLGAREKLDLLSEMAQEIETYIDELYLLLDIVGGEIQITDGENHITDSTDNS